MMKQYVRVLIATLAALLAGASGYFATDALRAPGLYSDAPQILASAAWSLFPALVVYLAVPLVSLAFLEVRRPKGLSLPQCVAVPVAWLLLVYLLWAWKPLWSSGEFPWWSVRRHFFGPMPAMLLLGWVFWRVKIAARSSVA